MTNYNKIYALCQYFASKINILKVRGSNLSGTAKRTGKNTEALRQRKAPVLLFYGKVMKNGAVLFDFAYFSKRI